jgi:hypothetical protein
MPEINHQFAETCAQVMKGINLTLSELREKAPRGFWESVRKELNDAQIPMPKGGQWEKGSQLSQHWKRNQKEIPAIIGELLGEEISEPNEEGFEEPVVVQKVRKPPQDAITREEFEEFKTSIQELIAGRAGIYQTGQTESEGQRPLAPAPPQEGKKFTVKRGKIGITIDPVLKELLEKESKQRGVNKSRLLDTIIWYYYGCPLLSFQN